MYGCPCGATLPTAKLLAGLPRKLRARIVGEKGGMRKKHEHAEHAPRIRSSVLFSLLSTAGPQPPFHH